MTFGQHIRVFICVVIMGCIVGYVLNGSEIDTDSPFIDYVKAQEWPYLADMTMRDILGASFTLVHWEYFETQSGQHVVQFTGTNDEEQMILQFIVDDERTSYEIGALKQNDFLLSPEKKQAYLEEIHKFF